MDDWDAYRLATAYVLAGAREDRATMDETFRQVLSDPFLLTHFIGGLTRLAHFLVIERTGSEEAALVWLEDRVRRLASLEPPSDDGGATSTPPPRT